MSRFVVTGNWDDNAPHLSEQARLDLWASIPAYQQDARTKGIPQLGAGVIYPVPDNDLYVEAFPIPDHWPRGYAVDVGWNRTAAIWRARNPDTGVNFLYDEYYRGEADPTVHGAAIRSKGVWIPGRMDPAARSRSQVDGQKLMRLYRQAIYHEEGDDVTSSQQPSRLGSAFNGVEAGLYVVLMAMQEGRLKVMRGRCPNFMQERRLYRRDEKGRVVKNMDHACDSVRYVMASGDDWLQAKPAAAPKDPLDRFSGRRDEGGWMH